MGAVTYFIFADLNMDRMPRFFTAFVVSGILSYGRLAAIAVGRCARRYEHPTDWSTTASKLARIYAMGPGLIAVPVFALFVIYFLFIAVFVTLDSLFGFFLD